MIIVERANDVLNINNDVVLDGCTTTYDLHWTVSITTAGSAVGKVYGYAIRAAGIHNGINAFTAIHVILPGATNEDVVAFITVKQITVTTTIQNVIAAAAVKDVAATLTPEVVVVVCTDKAVDTVVRTNQVFNAVEGVA